jgi:hypothetical protein
MTPKEKMATFYRNIVVTIKLIIIDLSGKIAFSMSDFA